MRRIEKDPEGGWIARRRDVGPDWRQVSLDGQKSDSMTACLAADRLFQRQFLSVMREPSRRPATGSCAPRHDKE